MTRRQTRYWFFRFQTELEEGGTSANGAPTGLKQHYEAHPHFGGWKSFGVTWDLDKKDLEVIVPLRYSLESEWNREVSASARELPAANGE